jgi:nicotinamidase-related amidase
MDEHTAPHFAKSALVTIDVQRDVLDGGPLEIPGTSAALPAMQLLVDTFREEGLPIVHVVRLYRADGSGADRCRRAALAGGARMLLAGSDGAELAVCEALFDATRGTADRETGEDPKLSPDL